MAVADLSTAELECFTRLPRRGARCEILACYFVPVRPEQYIDRDVRAPVICGRWLRFELFSYVLCHVSTIRLAVTNAQASDLKVKIATRDGPWYVQ